MNHLSITWEFHERVHVTYNLRINKRCRLPLIKTQGFKQESLSLNALAESNKNEPTLVAFKKRIKDRIVMNLIL